jgi:ParB-like chromosome segregation protein Spo0J
MSDLMGIDAQPITCVQWINRTDLDANDYNPNHVAPPELRLLKRSILTDGWLFPLLVCPPAPDDKTDKPYVLVDGYHRWLVSDDPAVFALTGGFLPCIVLPISLDRAHRMAMTVRMNRAKGTHHVRGMAAIVGELATALGRTPQEVIADLGMDKEEFGRLLDKGKMTLRHGQEGFNNGWVPG